MIVCWAAEAGGTSVFFAPMNNGHGQLKKRGDQGRLVGISLPCVWMFMALLYMSALDG